MYRWEQKDYARQLRESPHRAEMREQAGDAFDHYLRTDDSGARPVPARTLTDWLARGWLVAPEPPPESQLDPVPALVLDPFCGAGTTGMVAAQLGRDFVGFDLNPKYCEMARKRIEPHARQAVLL